VRLNPGISGLENFLDPGIAIPSYKVTLRENVSDKVVRHSLAYLSIRAKMIGGGRPLKHKFCIK